MSTILIVDDNAANLEFLEALFLGSGFDVVRASDGAEALELARSSPPAVIVSDVLMPVMDGFALCREWRLDPLLCGVPFLFLTASYTDPRDEKLALELGADRFLVKPQEPDRLLECVREVLASPAAARNAGPPEGVSDAGVMRQYNEALVRRLETKLVQLKAAVLERDENERRLRHVASVLRSVRDVSKLIVQEKRRGPLIQAVCERLVATRGFHGAWVMLTDALPDRLESASAGIDPEAFGRLCGQVRSGTLPACCHSTPVSGRAVSVEQQGEVCSGCPLAGRSLGRDAMVAPIVYNGCLYGYLGVLIPIEFHWDDDEIALLSEIAADIALALRGIQSEEERVRMEAQLGRLQRLEAVGQLAGGVAHDFNNLFMGIMSYVELCRDEIASDHPIRVWLDEITEDAQRSADLTRQLLAFARRQVSTPRVLDLNDAVGDSLRTLRRILGEDIALVWQPSIRDCRVKMDPGQVVQILTSLCSNARDAIAGVGRVTISTDTVRVTAELCAQEEDAVPGDYVMLRVFDDGCGMDPEDLDRVFEPFFTTRNVGEGTGLGLSTVYGIVRQNGGFVTVDSAPGVGTAFQVYLPRVESGAAEVERGEPCRGGGETVLVVEDEKSVRIPATRFLERLGYHVLSAAHPGDALRLAGAHAGSIDLVVTDVVMPGMSGRDLVKALVESRPGLRSLFISGYPVGTITEPRGAPGEGAAFLQKPFGREDLARRVREVLDAPPGPGRARTAPASPRSRDEDPR